MESSIHTLQNVVATVEDFKEKISDEEYKKMMDLLKLAYEKEKFKELKAIKFIHVLVIQPKIIGHQEVLCDNNGTAKIEHLYEDELDLHFSCAEEVEEDISIHANAILDRRSMVFKVSNIHQGKFIDLDNSKMTTNTYEDLKHQRFVVQNNIVYIFQGECCVAH